MSSRVAVILTVASVLAGCGGGDDGGGRLSQAELVSQADAICKDYEGKLNALTPPVSAEEVVEFADKSVPIAQEGTAALGELRPPEALQETYDAWLAQGEKAIDIVKRLRAAAQEGDQPELQRIAAEAQSTDAESNRLADELGLKECGGQR
jgi:hypothetical protein